MTKAQQVYDRVEALVASGIKKADAFRKAADEFGQPFNSVRGAYYTHTRSLGGTPGAKGRKAQPVPVDPIEAAASVLEQALEAIDEEVEAARERAEEAQAAYQELSETAAVRRATIEAKIEALNASE